MTIKEYNSQLQAPYREIAELLMELIDRELVNAESKIWHAHPVWFLNKNPIVGYSKQKEGLRLMFWSGAEFEEEWLSERGGKFKDASVRFFKLEDIDESALKRCLQKAPLIQYDYGSIVKNKGVLNRLA